METYNALGYEISCKNANQIEKLFKDVLALIVKIHYNWLNKISLVTWKN